MWPDPRLKARWDLSHYAAEGNAQPWIQLLLYSLITATRANTVVEFGSFRGVTTAWLALAVEANGGGTVNAIERNASDAQVTSDYTKTYADALPRTTVIVHLTRTLDAIATLHTDTDFIFLDDDKCNVPEKVAALRAHGCKALLACHDVDHDYDGTGPKSFFAREGLVIPSPILHEHGHLGLIQL